MRDTRRTRVVLAVLLLVSFTLITLDLRGGGSGPVGSVRSFVAGVFAPVQRAGAAVVNPVRDFFGGLSESDQERLDRLQKENDQLRLQARADAYARARAAELDALLRTAGLGTYRIVPARVISVGPGQGFAWTAQIDAGSRDGLKVGMTVINGDGLVGRVKTLTAGTATILLAIDPESTVGGRLENTLEIGLVNGKGLAPLELQVLDPQAALAKGDRIVTRGSSAFVAGVPIGTVTAIQGSAGSLVRLGSVQPFVDFTALDLVGVIVQPPRTDPRDSVLPPRPTPTASPSATATAPGPAASRSPSPSPSPSKS